nr:MAG TPA: hypothetical protein [Caudoviricetes sp.]
MVRKKTLRLFQKLLRLFQPERYDYCSPLLAIGRKPEKRAAVAVNGSALPCQEESMMPDACQANARRGNRRNLRRAGMVCNVLHRLV